MDKIEITTGIKADILSGALPYIQRYYGRIVVVKYGGNAMLSEPLKDAVMRDIVMLSLIGVKVVLVHGGGPEINDMLGKIGKEPKFVGGLRYTDDETADIVLQVLAGKVNKGLVSKLQACGGKALGLCGIDGGMIKAKKKSGADLGNVGEVTDVDPSPIINALNNGYIPVIATVSADAKGKIFNINADTAASRIAAALGAENLVLMTDIRGLLMDRNDENTLISEVNVSEVPSLERKGIISGGMIPKVQCCVEAVRRGVKQSIIIDGRIPHAILIDMLTSEGVGTLFR